ncbi:MAG TPA: HPF/RaiA family ribosome-associated protein [Cryomorphaceae bacterium]|nr:HPF/RaiA family ribosome-associated protein [Cryomorphaceae bacterium]
MQIQVNTDNNIDGSERLEAYVTEAIEHGLRHYVDKITRVEVHLSDQNADKEGADDIRCRIEARVEGLQPLMVESNEETNEKAISAAADKIQARLRTEIGKMKSH